MSATTMTGAGVLALLRGGRSDEHITHIGSYSYAKPLPRIDCVDGFSLSVQAGSLLYSTPREDRGPWSTVEVGYPSERPEPWDEWAKYVEEAERPSDTVYGYVPLALVEALVASHGGPA